MATTKKSSRAWIPATVTTLLLVLLLFGSGLLREILDDADIQSLRDPESALGAFIYYPMAPLGGPGIVGPVSFGEGMTRVGSGLVPAAILVFFFTWLAARAGSAFSTLLGAWLGTVLGATLGALVASQVFLGQNDFPERFGAHRLRLGWIETGLYWGAVAGFLLGLVAMLTQLISGPSDSQAPDLSEPTPWPPPDEPAAYPPPPRHAAPAPDGSEETVIAPDPSSGDRPPSI